LPEYAVGKVFHPDKNKIKIHNVEKYLMDQKHIVTFQKNEDLKKEILIKQQKLVDEERELLRKKGSLSAVSRFSSVSKLQSSDNNKEKNFMPRFGSME
jgi:hypothetical protein